jgi:hypothetical protein
MGGLKRQRTPGRTWPAVVWIVCLAAAVCSPAPAVATLSFGPAFIEGGDLVVTTDPEGALVRLNSEVLGLTPLEPLRVPPGWYLVQAEEANLFASARVLVDAGRVTTVALTLGDDRGILLVESTPDAATVRLDGQDRGRTPLRLEDVPAGVHDLRIHRESYAEYSTSVDVREGEESWVRVDLPLPARLEVRSEPESAFVFLGNRYAGRTPLLIPEARPGPTEVTLRLEYFNDWKQTLELEQGESRTVTGTLSQVRQPLNLRSEPAGAEVEMDGRAIGVTPLAWSVPCGDRRFVFRHAGHQDFVLKTRVTGNMPPDLRVTLFPLEGYLVVRGAPTDARISSSDLGSGPWMPLPASLPARAGMRTFRLAAPGFEPVRLEVEIQPGLETLAEPRWVAKSDRGGFFRALVPGWAQRYQGKRLRSVLFPAAQALTVAGIIVTTQSYNDAVDGYETAWTRYRNAVAPDEIADAWREAGIRHDRVEDRRSTRNLFLAAAAGVYVLHLADVLFLDAGPDSDGPWSLTLTDDSGGGAPGIRLGFTLRPGNP